LTNRKTAMHRTDGGVGVGVGSGEGAGAGVGGSCGLAGAAAGGAATGGTGWFPTGQDLIGCGLSLVAKRDVSDRQPTFASR